MYEAFYGLTEKPFNLTPDPRFLFLSEKHKDAFAHLLFGIKNRSGFVMVSGEIGTGKTTICRNLLNQLDPDTELAFIFNPCLSPEELLRKINEDFGIPSRAQSVKELIDELNTYLLDHAAQGKNCVLVIDEAQNLATNVLEQIRLLSNLETETQKLLQIILIGQPELAHHLQLPELRQLNQRITARYHLKPLDHEETLQYIAYRLRIAGGRKKVHFTRAAVRAVYRFSKGTPRVINAICDRSLLIGYTKEVRDITTRIVRQAAQETRGEMLRPKRPLREVLKPFLPNPTLVVAAPLTAIAVLVFANYVMPRWDAYVPPKGMPASVTVVKERIPVPGESKVEATSSQPAGDKGLQPLVSLGTEQADIFVRQPFDTTAPTITEGIVKPSQDMPGVSEERLASMDPEGARRAAVAGMLRAWNRALIGAAPQDDSVECLAEFAHADGFAAEPLAASAEEIAAIGLPALTLIRPGDQPLWVCLLDAKDGNFRITTDGSDTAIVPGELFRNVYAGQAIIFWRDPDPDGRTLKKEMAGPEVRRLQEDLRVLDRLSEEPTGTYDDRTVRAVSKIQADTGIRIDGKAGRQIRMILSSWLADASTPVLGERKIVARAPEQRPSDAPEQAEPPVAESPPPQEPEAAPAIETLAPPKPAEEEHPLPEVALSPATESDQTPASPPLDAAQVKVEELPPPPRDDVLAPPKTEVPKEVTPPVFGAAPLVPREPEASDTHGKPSP